MSDLTIREENRTYLTQAIYDLIERSLKTGLINRDILQNIIYKNEEEIA